MTRRGTFQFGRTTIDYRVETRPKRSTVLVTVDPADGVVLYVPPTATPIQIERIVRKRAPWILDARAEFSRVFVSSPRKYVSGESYAYLGRNYTLEILRRSDRIHPPVALERGRLIVSVPKDLTGEAKSRRVRRSLVGWFRERAAVQTKRRVERFAQQVGAAAPPVFIRDQLKRWGSCDHRGNIRLNWRIVMAPSPLVDYLCAHEVCHLVHTDHSPEFWKLLGKIMPDYEIRRERLRVYGPMFDMPEVAVNGR